MHCSDQRLEEAAAYVAKNANLRAALGMEPATPFRLSPLGQGEHNLNFRIDDLDTGRAYVLRINVAPQPFHASQVAYEHAALAALEPSGCTPRALYLDTSPQAPGKGVLAETFCEGVELDFDDLRPGELRCAAQLMADVHAVPVGESCSLHRPCDPLRELFEECLERYEAYRTSAFEEERITAWAQRFIAAAKPLLDIPCPASDRTHIINTETLPSHFLIAKAGPRDARDPRSVLASGAGCEEHASRTSDKSPTSHESRISDEMSTPCGMLIDWERPIIGEVAQDVAYFTSPTSTFWDSDFLFPTSWVEGFVEDYWRAVGGRFACESFGERFGAWRAMTALRSVTWCCKALARYKGNASGAHVTEKTARKLPTYLSDDFMEMLAVECFGL